MSFQTDWLPGENPLQPYFERWQVSKVLICLDGVFDQNDEDLDSYVWLDFDRFKEKIVDASSEDCEIDEWMGRPILGRPWGHFLRFGNWDGFDSDWLVSLQDKAVDRPERCPPLLAEIYQDRVWCSPELWRRVRKDVSIKVQGFIEDYSMDQ